MGIRILTGTEGGDERVIACLFCSVNMTAFGPIFYPDEDHERGNDEPQRFLDWYTAQVDKYRSCPVPMGHLWPVDVRRLDAARLSALVAEWRSLDCPDGDPREPDMNAPSAAERLERDCRRPS